LLPYSDPRYRKTNLKLAALDSYVQSQGASAPFFLLKETLKSLQKPFDYIIIDCPPSLGLLNINALVASNEVIVPVQCEYFAMEAVAAILSSITKIQNDYNPDLKIEGFLLTMYDPRTSLDTEVAQQVRKLFKENTFVTSIPRNVSIPESSARGEPVTTWRPSAQGSLAYFALAREVMDHE
jgi:chromosome partitioning protein